MNVKYPNLKVAIVSASEDNNYVKFFKNSLKPLVSEVWTFNDILADSNIKKSTQSQLKEADVVVLLLSSDFFCELYGESGYNEDLYLTLEKRKGDTKILVPVLLRSCIWDSLDMGTFFDEQELVPERKALLSYSIEERDDVMTSIVRNIEAKLHNISNNLVRIAIPNWIGYIGGIIANNGFKANSNSDLTNKSGKLIEFVIEDNLEKVKTLLLQEKVNLAWATLDQISYFNADNDDQIEAVFFVSQSKTADIIIMKTDGETNGKEIKPSAISKFYEILKNNKANEIVVANNSPSLTFLLQVIKRLVCDYKTIKFEIKFINADNYEDNKVNQVVESNQLDAIILNIILCIDVLSAIEFYKKHSSSKFLVTWKPYDKPISNVIEILNSSSDNASDIPIQDILIAKSKYLRNDENIQSLQKIFRAWSESVEKINKLDGAEQDNNVNKYTTELVEQLAVDIPEYFKNSLTQTLTESNDINGVKLCNMDDNIKFFALDFNDKKSEGIIIGEDVFEKIHALYSFFFRQYSFYHSNIKIDPTGQKIIESSVINTINSTKKQRK